MDDDIGTALCGILAIIMVGFVVAIGWQTTGILGVIGAGLMLYYGSSWAASRELVNSKETIPEKVWSKANLECQRSWGLALIGFLVLITGALAQL